MSLIFVNFITSIPDYISLAVEKNSTIAYLTICLAMFLENIIPPIPSEIIMPLGGFFVYQQKLNFYILVFWGRLVPGIRTLISVPAGIELMPLRKFLLWTTFGSLIWVALLTYSGYLFGENYQIIETYLDQIKYALKPILILIFLYFFIKILIRFLKKNRA